MKVVQIKKILDPKNVILKNQRIEFLQQAQRLLKREKVAVLTMIIENTKFSAS